MANDKVHISDHGESIPGLIINGTQIVSMKEYCIKRNGDGVPELTITLIAPEITTDIGL